MSQEQEGFIADIWPTGRCDMDCPFCYGADVPVIHPSEPLLYTPTPETVALTGSSEPRHEVSANAIKSSLRMLANAGLNKINIGGGEPLSPGRVGQRRTPAGRDLGRRGPCRRS